MNKIINHHTTDSKVPSSNALDIFVKMTVNNFFKIEEIHARETIKLIAVRNRQKHPTV